MKSCADAEYYAASDVPQTQVDLIKEWYSVATAAWGNYGPVEIWVVGNDVEAAKQLEDRWCEVHTAKDPKWNVEWDCFDLFQSYIQDGGAAIREFRRDYLDYDFFLMTMSSTRPHPDEVDYKIVTMHEAFHIYQGSHIFDRCDSDIRTPCGRDEKMVKNPWWSEGGAEYMAQLLYSRQEGVAADYLKERMEWKLQSKNELVQGKELKTSRLAAHRAWPTPLARGSSPISSAR